MEFNHTFTQMLVISLISYEMRNAPWWNLVVAIAGSGLVALVIAPIMRRVKGE